MKILLYAEPTTLLYLPYPMNLVYRNHLYTWIAKNLQNHSDVEIKSIIPKLALDLDKDKHYLDNINPIAFSNEDLFKIFPNALSMQEMFLKVFNNKLEESEHTEFQNIIFDKLGNWEPDIIISYAIHNDLLKQAYPKALHMLVENGLFSRPPFPRTLRYEPIHFLNGFLNKYENEIRNFYITNEQKKLVQNFKYNLREIIENKNPYKNILKELKQQYKHLILCPIPTDNLYKETKYDDQYLYLLNILEKIPDNIGLIITFHDDCSSQLNAGIIKTLQQKYKNLIYFPVEDNSYISQSLNFFEYCDAIINMHTMTGTQAMLWDLKVISLDKRYSKWFSDKNDLNNIEDFLAMQKKDNSNIIYWYMTHFCVFEHSMQKPEWYYGYFKNKLESYRKNGISFELFEQVEDFENISKFIIDFIKNSSNTQHKKTTLLQKVFSMRNEGKHKVIRILGFKLKLKRKKKYGNNIIK